MRAKDADRMSVRTSTRRKRSAQLIDLSANVSMRGIAFTNPEADCGVASVETAELLMQGTGKANGASSVSAGGVCGGISQS